MHCNRITNIIHRVIVNHLVSLDITYKQKVIKIKNVISLYNLIIHKNLIFIQETL
jgi:hypothetical protein